LVVAPSTSAQSGALFAEQPTVRLVDAAGNPVAQAGVGVTASVASGAGTIGGTTTVPDVPLTLQSTPVMYDAQPIGTLAGAARLLGTDLRIDRLVLDQGPGQLHASGHVDYETYAYDATVDGTGLTWNRPVAGANVEAVTVDVRYAGGGTLDRPGGSGTLSIAPTGGLGDFTGPADVRWQFAGGSAAVTAFWPKLRAWAQADVEPRAPYTFRGTAIVSRLDVQPLALTAGMLTAAVTGTIDFSAAFAGALSDLTAASAFVNLQDVSVAVGGLPVTLEHPARLGLRLNDYTIDDLAMRAGTSRLTAAGRFSEGLDEPLRASFPGDVADVTALARAFGAVPAGTTATGTLTANWESRGSISTARSTIGLASGTVTMDGLPPIDALMAAATFDGSTLTVDSLTAQWQGGAITGTARIPRQLLQAGATGPIAAAGRVDVAVVGLNEKALAPWLPASTVAGLSARVSATLGLDLTSAALTGIIGTLRLDEASVTAAGVPISQARPSYLSIAGGILTFDDVEFGAGVPVRLGGNVTFGDETALNVWLTGTPGLRPLSVLSPQMSVDGAAELDLWLRGTPQAPRIDGTITLDDAELVMREPRAVASDISGPIVFSGDRVSVSGLKGFLNGGDLEASGSVRYAGVDVMDGEIVFQARGVAVEYPDNVDSEIDALLTYVVGAAPILRGDVRILRSAYRATISLPALVAFNATRVVDVAAAPGYLDQLRLDVAVSTENDMIVDNTYGRFEAGADVRLQGTVAHPGVTGRAELREGGEIFLLNGVYRLAASTISFTDPTAIQPDMNITMVTQQNAGEVTVTLSGTLERLQTSVTSSDPNADPTLINVLLGGNNSLTGGDAVALLSGELLGVTGRALGLDALRIERGFETDFVRDPGLVADLVETPDTRLTLSKRLRADVEVILSRRLSGSGDVSAVVSYRPWRGVELRASSLDNNDRAFGIRHELSFGGGAATTAPRQVTTLAVADTAIEGASPEDERALRDELKLRRDKTFDFITWREDTERLQAWYRSRGYLEARVRASRTADTGNGRIGLVYRVTRGPRTELRVSGTTVSTRLRRELERVWSDAVFDGFRADEIRGAVAYDLVRRDIIGARVEAAVSTPDEGRKIIDVTVQGGEHVSAREIVFQGVQSLTVGDLDSTLKARGLNDFVWMDPSSSIEPLQSRYAEAGFRATTVTPSLPVVADGRATLPVVIEEGPLTTVRQVFVSGVGDDLAEAVTAIAQPLEGRAFRSAQVDDARRRIEALYRARGYNHVAVAGAVAIKDDHFAELTLGVTPGPQQVLQDVVVEGHGRTRPSAVINALRLETGAPADLTKWAEARKRVFDTNVFRQVDVRPEAIPGEHPDGI
ncbi:MAG: translocation/assembly module TamB domain-containing protein, partial [Acidobacteria bacterium]|nr:translocation/assembly module TamB domain-containing protein [Acidobacteriota bacterium]